MNDTQDKIGKVLPQADSAERDAIHIAVLPVWTNEEMERGEFVHFVPGKIDRVTARGTGDAVGIIDPFLHTLHVPANTRVWLFLQPNTVTGMRHHWSHPIVDAQGAVKQVLKRLNKTPDSEAWLRHFCGRYDIDYYTLLEQAQMHRGEICAGTDLDYNRFDPDELWGHIEEVTGRVFDKQHRENVVFRCSC